MSETQEVKRKVGRPRKWESAEARDRFHSQQCYLRGRGRHTLNRAVPAEKLAVIKEFQAARVAFRSCRAMGKWHMSYCDYLLMNMEQDGKCAICGQPETAGAFTRLSVDHDHSTGKVRGLLCHACNVGLGKFKESPAILRKATKYVEGAFSS